MQRIYKNSATNVKVIKQHNKQYSYAIKTTRIQQECNAETITIQHGYDHNTTIWPYADNIDTIIIQQ